MAGVAGALGTQKCADLGMCRRGVCSSEVWGSLGEGEGCAYLGGMCGPGWVVRRDVSLELGDGGEIMGK